MKAAAALILALGLLSAGLMVGANVAVHRQGDQVTVRAETLAGDPAAAEGLEVALPAEYSGQLLWDLSFPAARPDRLTTGFSFSLLPVHTSYIPDFPLLTIQVAQFGEALRHFSGGDELTDQDWADIPWGELFRQISGQTPAGESAVFTFDAAQYSRYLPLTMTGDRQYNVLPQSVTSYFPIPVPQDYTFTIELQKEADGSITGYSLIEDSGCSISLSALSVDAGDSLIFTLTNYGRREGTGHFPLDGSRIHGGWGLYRLTADEAQMGHVETLYSLPEGSMVTDFWGDGEDYFLLSVEEGVLRLRIFDRDVHLSQTLDLLTLDREEWYGQLYRGEDFLVPITDGGTDGVFQFAVLCRRDGGWQLDFTGDTAALRALDITPFNWSDYYFSPLYMAYNGRTLAIRDSESYRGTDFYLALYSKAGLEYLGGYSCSLDPPALEYPQCDLAVPVQSPLLTWTESGS